jgi:quercetin dioxygenase-like cupin family protein
MKRRPDELHPDLLETDALASDPLEPTPALRARLLATVSGATPLDGFAERLAGLVDLGAERARELLRATLHVAPPVWEAERIPGVHLLHFAGGPRHRDADCGLVHLAPGVRFPMHRHGGDEWALVLSGFAEEEESGERWGPGDLCFRPGGSDHAFRALGPAPFLFAVVLRGGLSFPGEPAA